MSLDSNDEAAEANDEATKTLDGTRIAFVGRLASMSKREAARLVRERGAVVTERPDASVDLVVIGEEGLPLGDASDPDELFDAETRRAMEQGTVQVVPETELWQRLGLVEAEQDVRRLYTPAPPGDWPSCWPPARRPGRSKGSWRRWPGMCPASSVRWRSFR